MTGRMIKQEQGGAWRPLLEGAANERAWAAIQEIVADLPDPATAELADASLAGGQAGLAVFCAQLALAGLDDGENAGRFLAQAAQAVAAQPFGPALYGGFTGVAWAAARLQQQLGAADGGDSHQAVDEALRVYLRRSPWRDDYDLVSGLVGLGVYALERLPHAAGAELLELVIARLAETAEHTAEGITWRTAPELLPDWQRELCPQGYYNLGLAHGVPGVIALLGQVCAAKVARAQAEPLLAGAVAWLLAQQLPASEPHSIFSSWVAPGEERSDCRLAWCYGDAGVAVALLAAARGAHEPEWERAALRIARRAAARWENAGVLDAGLCHGAAGLGHIFNRVFQATGEEFARDAARYWFEQTLALQQPGRGTGGFAAYRAAFAGQDAHWENETGILEGAAGVALALLAAVTPLEPAWDRLLLVALPPSASAG